MFRVEMDYKPTLKLLMNKLHVVSQLYMFVEVVNRLLINYYLKVVSIYKKLFLKYNCVISLFVLFFNLANNLGKRCSTYRSAASGHSKRWSAAPMIHDPKEKLRTVIIFIIFLF